MENKGEVIGVKRADQLQFLRFCAFFMVFTWHAKAYTYTFFYFGQGNEGANAVCFFLMLSGLVAGYGAYNKEVTFGIGEVATFMKKKIKRIYPLYLVTTILAIPASFLPLAIADNDFGAIKDGLIQLLKNLLMIQCWFDHDFYAFNGAGWYISTVMFSFLMTIPMLAIGTRIRKRKYDVVLFFNIIIVTFAIIVYYSIETYAYNWEFLQYVFPPARMLEYLIGVCIGYIIPTISKYVKNSIGSKIIWTIVEIAAFSYWIAAIYMLFPAWGLKAAHWVIPNICLLMVFGIGGGYISDLFKLKPLKHLGDLSFEAYLIHQLLILEFARTAGMEYLGGRTSIFATCFLMLETLLIVECLYRIKKKAKA